MVFRAASSFGHLPFPWLPELSLKRKLLPCCAGTHPAGHADEWDKILVLRQATRFAKKIASHSKQKSFQGRGNSSLSAKQLQPGSRAAERLCKSSVSAQHGYLSVEDILPWASAGQPQTSNKKARHTDSSDTRTQAHSVLDSPKTTTSEQAQCPKRRTSRSRKALRLEAGVFQHAQTTVGARGSDNAHLMEANWVGLADGVSGWAEQGVNSGLYCQELMWNCAESIRGSGFSDTEEEDEADEEGTPSPGARPVHPDATPWMSVDEREIFGLGLNLGGLAERGSAERRLGRRKKRLSREGKKPEDVLLDAQMRTELKGSCTATLASLAHEHLHIGTLGSSSFVLVRQGAVLGLPLPEHEVKGSEPAGGAVGTGPGEPLARVTDYHIHVQSGDALVLGTDKLFGSLSPAEIAGLVADSAQDGCSAEMTAKRLCCTALKKSQSPDSLSALTETTKQLGRQTSVVKGEDISALVAFVQ